MTIILRMYDKRLTKDSQLTYNIGMREVNLRTFIRNINKEIQDLPVTVTKLGKSYFVVTKVGDVRQLTDERQTIPSNVTNAYVGNIVTTSSTKSTAEVKASVRCALPGCTKEATELGYIWHDEDWVEKLMCELHARKSKVAYQNGF